MKSKTTLRWSSIGSLLLGLVVSVTGVTVAQGQDRAAARSAQAIPAHIQALKLETPAQLQVAADASREVLSRSLVGANGTKRVIIRLSLPAAGKMDENIPGAQLSQKLNIQLEQDSFVQRCGAMAPDMKVIARTQLVLNAVFVEVDAALLPALAKDPAVTRIAPVANYALDLTETVPYIGGTAVQGQGFDGSGIRVAVLDSGIDYTHANMGGEGTLAAYEAAWGTDAADPRNTTRDGLFPTDRVVDGYDFVGEDWPNTPEAPDEDPIDLGGHGSHVADIIGGANGVAPGVDLYAVKVCSAVATSCSGIALIQGMEFAVDPNGDGRIGDRVDVINMSLGSNYGQPFDDDLAQAVENASAMGVLTVASAGNSSDKPYITGTPAAAPSALSVAQTQVPSAFAPQFDVTAPASIAGRYDAVFQAWSVPLASTVEAQLLYGDGADGNLNGCEPFAPGSLTGFVVLVDRGACNFTLKISNVSQGGGLIGIIGLVAPGGAFSGGDGGERPIDIPGYMITQADSNALKSGLPGTVVKFDPAIGFPLVGTMVGSSSRGPSNQFQQIKPEIGAPGASVSMIAGSGTGEGPFGGTSGAAPMVAGSAALLLDAACDIDDSDSDSDSHKKKSNKRRKNDCPRPYITKARLMNTGETDIDIDPFSGPAEITRIGGGEVRVDRALGASAVAWDKDTGQGALSFGFVDVADGTVTLTKKVRVMGLDSNDGDSDSDSDKKGKNSKVTYTITPTFRFADDAANGAVSVTTSKSSVTVKRNSKKNFKVTMTIDGSLLPGNFMNSGNEGANGSALTANEYDGYLMLQGDNGDEIHLPWQVLPRKAARVEAPETFATGAFSTTVGLNNTGVGDAQVDGYALIAVSDQLPSAAAGEGAPTPDIRALGVNTIPVPAGFCSGEPSFLWLFATNTWERQSHVLPVSHIWFLDTDRDGSDDYAVLNRDLSGLGTISDGRQVTYALNLVTGDAIAFFFTEHSTNTGNTVHIICAEQIGLSGADLLATNVSVDVLAQDFYFGGPSDLVEDLVITPLGERFFPVTSDIPGNSAGSANIEDYTLFPGNTPELGVLLINNGDRGAGARGGATEDTEATLIIAE